MLHLRGAPALSDARLRALEERIRSRIPSLGGIAAEFVHFVDESEALGDRDRQILARLLTYGPERPSESSPPEGQLLLVTPRVGTISPWSSKATEIAQICGLTGVRRLERGIAYWVAGARADGVKDIAPFLHDRTTQTVFHRLDQAAVPFPHARPHAVRQREQEDGGA